MTFANCSLPAPVSPIKSTAESFSASFLASLITLPILSPRPLIKANGSSSWARWVKRRDAATVSSSFNFTRCVMSCSVATPPIIPPPGFTIGDALISTCVPSRGRW
ncbi:hypothetical protein D3C81_1527040 [compost metagenome]